ncbi:Uncharacterised protein [marine metagenome]
MIIASQILPPSRELVCGIPFAKERVTSSKSTGSTGRTRISGASASSANAMPDVSPPPPQQTNTSAAVIPTSDTCSAISKPQVPWPAMTSGSS